MDRLTSMEVFVKAVDLGSFAAAADALGMSAPMVGKHVRFLEDRLGVRLINRTTRRQSLTDVGREYCERCRLILAEAQAADAFAAHQMSEPRGTLRVTAPVHFGRHCVMPVLIALVGTLPNLELDLSLSDRLADLADDGYDLAIRTGPLDPRGGLTVRHIARQRMIVCGSPGYLDAHGYPKGIDELRRHRAIVYRRSGIVRPWQFPGGSSGPIDVLPESRIRIDDLAAVADAVADGAGLAWLPSWLVRERLERGHLVELLPELSGFPYDVSALWLSTGILPPKVRAAVDALARDVPKYMV